jgi:long-chain fatty acid transport protein
MIIGFTLPIPFGGLLEDRLVLGGAFFTPSSVLLEGVIPAPSEPQFNVLERVQAAGIMVGLGIDLHGANGALDGLRIGASVSVAADLLGDLFVRLDETSSFVSTVETKLVAGFAPIFGISYDRERWGVGVTYRFELRGDVDLDITAADLPVEVPALRVGGVIHYDPPTLAGEGWFRPLDHVRVILGVEASFWNDYPGPQTQVTSTSTQAPAPDYAPTVSPRLAVEGTLDDGVFDVALRAGYLFEPSPAGPAGLAPMRDASGNPTADLVPLRYLDNHRHVLTIGVGVTHMFDGGPELAFDGFAQLHALEPRTHDIGATAGAPPMKSSGLMVAGGWTLTLGLP